MMKKTKKRETDYKKNEKKENQEKFEKLQQKNSKTKSFFGVIHKIDDH